MPDKYFVVMIVISFLKPRAFFLFDKATKGCFVVQGRKGT